MKEKCKNKKQKKKKHKKDRKEQAWTEAIVQG